METVNNFPAVLSCFLFPSVVLLLLLLSLLFLSVEFVFVTTVIHGIKD